MADEDYNRRQADDGDYLAHPDDEHLVLDDYGAYQGSIDYIVYLYENIRQFIDDQALPFLDHPDAERNFYRFFLEKSI